MNKLVDCVSGQLVGIGPNSFLCSSPKYLPLEPTLGAGSRKSFIIYGDDVRG